VSESRESQAYVVDWLRQVPEFRSHLGLTERQLGRLRWVGSGGRADVVAIGPGRVLKVTTDPVQAMLSQAAAEDRPVGVVPVYDVVETDIPGRDGLGPTWGIVEKLLLPFGAEHPGQPDDDPEELEQRFWDALEAWKDGADPSLTGRRRRKKRPPLQDPLAEDWRLQIAAAVEWLDDVYPRRQRTVKQLDFHEGNFGIDPDTGDLLLLDLGQG
jgi:hypothetical protein